VADLSSILRTIGAVLGIWLVASLAAALVIVPWFRRRARANTALSQVARSEDWKAETGASRPRQPVVR
jgi:hypothetical protein